ncbi:MAG: hypothetical protein AB7S57_19625 [Acetobacteraceae bacterium]
METSKLQEYTKRTAMGMGARTTWPNGLGFDFLGWSYKYDEATGEWQAARPGFIVGSGDSPDWARRAARKIKAVA